MDKVLLEHPGVAEAATFAVADAVLGQAPQAAVTLRDGSAMYKYDAPYQLRSFMTTRLHESKVSSVWPVNLGRVSFVPMFLLIL